eukprot:353244_1
MDEIVKPEVTRVVKMWVIGALLYTMCTTGFICGIEGIKIIPGMAAYNFAEKEKVEIMVNKLTSIRTQIPMDYYSLPFCKPEGGVKEAPENLGDLLMGDRIENSPYIVHMNESAFCKVLCKPIKLNIKTANILKYAVYNDYHHNWLADGLPAALASASEIGQEQPKRYWGGVPVGILMPGHEGEPRFYLNNHMHIILDYHERDFAYSDKKGTDRVFRLVGFRVAPLSVDHKLKDDTKSIESGDPKKDYEFTTCSENKDGVTFSDTNRLEIKPNATVFLTYDVKWNKRNDIEWATRWDAYLSVDHDITQRVHWLYIIDSFVIVVFLSAMIGVTLIRNLNRDIMRYNRVPTDEERAEERDETGWKLVHADVFRPPTQYPMLFCAAVGTGAQLLCSVFSTMVFATIGFLSPANRGSLMIALLLLYVMFGIVAGYLSARLYKTFKGQQFRKCTLTTALLFPGIGFSIFFLIDIILAFVYNSTEAAPFRTIIELLLLWLAMSLLVFCGAYFGYNKPEIEFPVSTSNIPRQVPPSTSFLSPWVTILFGGLLPFASVVIEMYCVMSDIWMDEYYYVFGFLFLIFLILILTCADVAIVCVYIQLCAEDYNWWWRSFFATGSTAFYLLLYSCWYFTNLHATKFMTYLLYFGYMTIILLEVFLICGSIGFGASLWFNRKIFSSVKVD